MLSNPTKRLLEEIASLATDVGHEVVDAPPVHRWTMALFDRCRSAFAAIRILADEGFGHEALALCRSLVTESLMLMELAAADEERRADLLRGWALAANDDLIGLLREWRVRSGGDSSDLVALEASLSAASRETGAGIRKWRVNEKELAYKHKRDVDYLEFRRMHHFVHGSAFAMSQRYSNEGGVWRVDPAGSAESAEPTAVLAASLLLDAVEAEISILGLPQPAAMKGLRERVVAERNRQQD